MTTTDADEPTSAGAPGITRLDAYDGLFLRAEHLRLMQDYARDLAYALGVAGGSGVVSGFGVRRLDDEHLAVDPGLAIAPDGRPLRSTRVLVVERPATLPAHSWFRLELRADDQGGRPVALTTQLCAPCGSSESGEGTATPYRTEGVRAELVVDTEQGFDGWPVEARRGRLASLLFAREDRAGWPGPPGRTAGATLPRDWAPAPAPTPGPGVPLALLLPSGDGRWALDTWAARRDRTATPPEDAWRRRLAMRPWSAFVAQILQFQAQYADASPESGGASRPPSLREFVEQVLGARGEDESGALDPDELREAAEAAAGSARADLSLPALTPELPPAGFLAIPRDDTELAVLDELLGDGVRRTVASCGLGDIGLAVEQARHRPRIRLEPGPDGPDTVEILVPFGIGPGGGEVRSRLTDWVAFVHADGTVRRRERRDGDPEPGPDGGDPP